MGRPSSYSRDDIVDAAIRLFSDGGARALTMSAVARSLGAPSGSVYHRFANRPALLAEIWLRSSIRFRTGFSEALGEDRDGETVVHAAAWVVDWCRDRLPEAMVLDAGVKVFSPESWSPQDLLRLEQEMAERDSSLAVLIGEISVRTDLDPDEAAFVLLEMPLAVARRHLSSGLPPPQGATDLAKKVAKRTVR
jgi:AcrR family transcriptional regulator